MIGADGGGEGGASEGSRQLQVRTSRRVSSGPRQLSLLVAVAVPRQLEAVALAMSQQKAIRLTVIMEWGTQEEELPLLVVIMIPTAYSSSWDGLVHLPFQKGDPAPLWLGGVPLAPLLCLS